MLDYHPYKGVQGIYAIKCSANNKIYIGKASVTPHHDMYRRLRLHKSCLHDNKHHNHILQSDYNLYGDDSFDFLLLEVVPDKSMLDIKEDYWMNHLSTYINQNGYNMRENSGTPCYSIIISKDCKERIGKTLRCKKPKNKYRGVRMLKGKWVANIKYFGKSIYLGTFNNQEDAARQVDYYSIKLFGEDGFYKNLPDYDYSSFKPQLLISLHEADDIRIGNLVRRQFVGVYTTPGSVRHVSRIKKDNVCYNLGSFGSLDEAAMNYDFYSLKIYGNKAYLNFTDKDYSNFIPKFVISEIMQYGEENLGTMED